MTDTFRALCAELVEYSLAVVDFQHKYPAIHEFMNWLNDLYFEEMPGD